MLDLKVASHEDFEACLNQLFTIDDEIAGAVAVELVEVDTHSTFDPDRQSRPPFSILFIGKPEPALAQGVYRMHQEQLGSMELFLVPIGLDAKGMHYEAVFT